MLRILADAAPVGIFRVSENVNNADIFGDNLGGLRKPTDGQLVRERVQYLYKTSTLYSLRVCALYE